MSAERTTTNPSTTPARSRSAASIDPAPFPAVDEDAGERPITTVGTAIVIAITASAAVDPVSRVTTSSGARLRHPSPRGPRSPAPSRFGGSPRSGAGRGRRGITGRPASPEPRCVTALTRCRGQRSRRGDSSPAVHDRVKGDEQPVRARILGRIEGVGRRRAGRRGCRRVGVPRRRELADLLEQPGDQATDLGRGRGRQALRVAGQDHHPGCRFVEAETGLAGDQGTLEAPATGAEHGVEDRLHVGSHRRPGYADQPTVDLDRLGRDAVPLLDDPRDEVRRDDDEELVLFEQVHVVVELGDRLAEGGGDRLHGERVARVGAERLEDPDAQRIGEDAQRFQIGDPQDGLRDEFGRLVHRQLTIHQ